MVNKLTVTHSKSSGKNREKILEKFHPNFFTLQWPPNWRVICRFFSFAGNFYRVKSDTIICSITSDCVFTMIINTNFRQMMHMDSPMLTLSKNDGIISLMHCQDRNFVMLRYWTYGDQVTQLRWVRSGQTDPMGFTKLKWIFPTMFQSKLSNFM